MVEKGKGKELMDALIVGCGLTGSVIARELAEHGKQVVVLEKRDHIGGNMYDYTEEHGFLVQKYGPHAFHTTKEELYEYMCQYEEWQPYNLMCGADWDGRCTPTPFNFKTIDTFYNVSDAERIKEKLTEAFPGRETVTVVEVLEHSDSDVRGYAEFLFRNDYAPYTAKQWGIAPSEIDPSVLKRVPLRFSYGEGYFDDEYQVMPVHSFTKFFENLLNHPNIKIELGVDAMGRLSVLGDALLVDGVKVDFPVIYTGALDELFEGKFGWLPYRSLRFEWKYADIEGLQEYPVVAYPKEDYTRITEFKKIPPQDKRGTIYAEEYPLPYTEGAKNEPYYPVLTEHSQQQYEQYKELANRIPNLFCCGRLADFKYYNMDQALERALAVAYALVMEETGE